MKHVLVSAPFPKNLMDKLTAVSDELTVEQISISDRTWPDGKTTNADIFYALGTVPPLHLAPNLRWVQAHFAGVDHFKKTDLWDSDVMITNASGIHGPNIGQYVMAQLLAWSHRVPRWMQHKQKKEWPSPRWDAYVPDELRGKTLGILGYGSLGREIARLAKAFGMKILVTKRDARTMKDSGFTILGTGDPEGTLPDRIYPGEATRSMVVECDYVVITLPLTDKTYNLFDEALLKAMKPSCFIVNVGRGGIINEKDLVKALKKGWIAGAGLDVYETEPLPSNSPLWDQENLILTPHVSGFTKQYDERATDLFAENLRRYMAGKPLLNVVNRELGY